MVFVEATFPSKALVLCKYKHVYYVTKKETFFSFFVEESSKLREQQKPSLAPAESMLEVTPLVCV